MRLFSRAFIVLAVVVHVQAAQAQQPGAGTAAPGASAGSGVGGAANPTPSTPPPSTTTNPNQPASATPPADAKAADAKAAELKATTEAGKPTEGEKPAAPINLSLPPSTPTIGGGTPISPKIVETLTPTTTGAADEWKFEFHGYFRAPMRVSFGPATPTAMPSIYSVSPDPRPPGSFYLPNEQPPPGTQPPGTQWHSPVRVPGYLYTNWEYTNTVHGPWAQLNFSYGNSRAMATVIVDSYSQTDGGYRHLQAQQGIDMAFLTLNFPEALGDWGTLVWNIGTFQNRYGQAGKYDGGMYETYLFGRTHMSGETLTANLTNLDAAGNWALTLEHGVGAKIEIVPFLNNPYHRIFSNVPVGGNNGSPYLGDRDAEYLPYAGAVPQGSTFVHHAHLFAKYQKLLTFGAHYLYTWTPDDNWHPINSRSPSLSDNVPRVNGPIQGSIAITGGEVRYDGGVYGYGYLGYSHMDARNINALADAIEVLHSYGGYQLKQNFFGKTFNRHTGVYQGPQNETGTVDTVLAQYSFSFGQYARYPEDFWGDGPDLVLTAFGMLSIVDSKAPRAFGGAERTEWDMSTKKLKFGLDALYTPLEWLGFGARYDMVQPDLDAAYSRTTGNPGGSDLNFSVVNLRLVFKTQFVTHEAVTLNYGHYFLGDAAYPTYPYDWVPKADSDLLYLSATMWW